MDQLYAKDFIGKTKTQKLLDEITSEYQETFMKKFHGLI